MIVSVANRSSAGTGCFFFDMGGAAGPLLLPEKFQEYLFLFPN
jgi:hypothetical protein